jgi:two-component system chemotaxis response regulator CheB
MSRQVDAVVIGASAGGVEALIKLLGALPKQWRLPVVVVLHLPERRESLLVPVFAQRVPIRVREAADKAPVEPGTLYFAPPSYHLSIERERVFSLSCERPVMWSRPSIDLLMASAADAYGPALAAFCASMRPAVSRPSRTRPTPRSIPCPVRPSVATRRTPCCR